MTTELVNELDDSAFFLTQSYITELCYLNFYQICLLNGSCLSETYTKNIVFPSNMSTCN